jgi:hypothetical protein
MELSFGSKVYGSIVLCLSILFMIVIGAHFTSVSQKLSGAGTQPSSYGTAQTIGLITYYVKDEQVDYAEHITYATPSGGIEQVSGVSLPWYKTFRDVKIGTVLSVTAQRRRGAGPITVEIRKDGSKWKRAQSKGEYTIATCSAIAGEP